jgi:hypothetical protein
LQNGILYIILGGSCWHFRTIMVEDRGKLKKGGMNFLLIFGVFLVPSEKISVTEHVSYLTREH